MNLSKQFTRREKILLAILGVLLVCAVYFLAVHRPVTEELARIGVETQTAETELTVLQAKSARMEQMQKELAEILADDNAAQTPDYNNLQQVMTFLNAVMAASYDYEISFAAVTPPTGESAGVLRRTAQIKCLCPDYKTARRIVENLRDCPYRCLVDDMSIAPPTAGRDETRRPITSGSVQLDLTVTFFEKQK